jgi:hypothetical protein
MFYLTKELPTMNNSKTNSQLTPARQLVPRPILVNVIAHTVLALDTIGTLDIAVVLHTMRTLDVPTTEGMHILDAMRKIGLIAHIGCTVIIQPHGRQVAGELRARPAGAVFGGLHA